MKLDSLADTELLHYPARAESLESLENHLISAAQLARALWELTSSKNLDTQDERSRSALEELASAVADHASAARFVFYQEQETKSIVVLNDPIVAAFAELEQVNARVTSIGKAHSAAEKACIAAQEADARAGFDKLEAEWNAVVDEQTVTEMTVLKTKPTTRGGALTLLLFVADDLGRFSGHDKEVRAAIYNAVAVLRQEIRAC